MGVAIAAQCKRLGIQVNYAPDIDINNNPGNPVINDRSFGEDKNKVLEYGIAYMKGMQDNGVMATAKHFPGHGDVTVDSHKDIPVINKSRTALDSLELVPFRALIAAGVQSVMVAHLSVPAIDSGNKRPTSLSYKAVQELLKNELGFKGIAVTDALDMKAISNYYPQGEANVQAILAGNDMLCLPGEIGQSIEAVKVAIKEKRINKKEIDKRVLKILHAKYQYGLHQFQPLDTTNLLADLNKSVNPIKQLMSNQALAYAHPTKSFDITNNNSIYLALNTNKENAITAYFRNKGATVILIDSNTNDLENLIDNLSHYNNVIIGVHNYSRRPANQFGIPSKIIDLLNHKNQLNALHIIFGNPYAAAHFNQCNNVLFANEDNVFTQNAAIQWLEGTLEAEGKLPVTVCKEFPMGTSDKRIVKGQISTTSNNTISDSRLVVIDSIVNDAINRKAIPGCQVLIAKNKKIIYQKAFGKTGGEDSSPVTLSTVYDLASVTKVSATTIAVMKLYEQGKLDLQQQIGFYLPWLRGSDKERIVVKDLLLHQAGLVPYIKFYEQLIGPDGNTLPQWVSNVQDNSFNLMLTPGKYLKSAFKDTIQSKIKTSPVKTPGKYVYSDNDFLLLAWIVESISGKTIAQYVNQAFYSPLQMSTTGYLPLEKMPINQIAYTEVDNYFRKELIRGSVHDEGSATLGGIAGHAGLFSNATDLATLYLMLLNNGEWDGKKYFDAQTIQYFTNYASNVSRRGIGFDKPEKDNSSSKDPYPCKLASTSTFGHTGFTGTCVWADPENDILFIFLSNRVYPTRDNKAFSELNLRPKIQDAVYNILLSK
jgi:beta-glucosidase-like glycosyl hydrolase/CubicO group peptidase (beta-lactamase class C family)